MPQLDIYTFLHQIGNFIPSMFISYIILIIWIIPNIFRVLAYRRLIINKIIEDIMYSVEEREKMYVFNIKMLNWKKIYEYKIQNQYKSLGDWCMLIKNIEEIK